MDCWASRQQAPKYTMFDDIQPLDYQAPSQNYLLEIPIVPIGKYNCNDKPTKLPQIIFK
jgi:hypothetical protein